MKLPPDPISPPPPPEKLRGSSALRYARRVVIAVVGFTVIFLGTIFLLTPAPGVPTILGGLGILALEFSWARRWLQAVKDGAEVVQIEFRAPRTRSLLRRVWLLWRGFLYALWVRGTMIFRRKYEWPPKRPMTLHERAVMFRRRFRPMNLRGRSRRLRGAMGRLWQLLKQIGFRILDRSRKTLTPPPEDGHGKS